MRLLRVAESARWSASITLVKALALLLLSAVVLTLALPAVTDFLARASISAGADKFVEALHTARMEALNRNSPVTICKSLDREPSVPSCAGSEPEWAEGWVIFVDQGTMGSIDATDKVIAVGRAEGRIDVAETPSRLASVTFNPVGPITGAAGPHEFRFASTLTSGSFERVICLSILGRASTARTGTCRA